MSTQVVETRTFARQHQYQRQAAPHVATLCPPDFTIVTRSPRPSHICMLQESKDYSREGPETRLWESPTLLVLQAAEARLEALRMRLETNAVIQCIKCVGKFSGKFLACLVRPWERCCTSSVNPDPPPRSQPSHFTARSFCPISFLAWMNCVSSG